MLASKAALRGRDPSIPASLVQLCNGCREQRGRGGEKKKEEGSKRLDGDEERNACAVVHPAPACLGVRIGEKKWNL